MSTNDGTRQEAKHTWRFFRAGGFDQVCLDTGADLMALDQLDQKLWVALACPTRGLEFDSKTLDLIDADKDGRIRVPEIIAAVKWAGRRLKNPDDLLKSSPSLPLAAINDSTPEGAPLLASARQILVNLGKPDAAAISIDDTADTARIFSQTKFNGDGIVPADSAEDPAVAAVIQDIIACLGAETDRSGKPGVSQAKADQFFAEALAYSDWWAKAESDKNVLLLGEVTASAAAALAAVRAKVDDYFARGRLAAFDPRALAALNRQESEYLAIAVKDLTITAAEVAGFPLARIEIGRPLPLGADVNPAWAGAVAKLRAEVIGPLLGDKDHLTEAQWESVKARFAALEAWSASKAGAAVERLGLPRVREILSSRARESIAALVAKDKALEGESNAIASVDQLVRYHRDLYKLLVNFVSFRDFYGRKEKAVFQAGTLYLDQRSCDLCVRVDDMARHGTMVHLSQTYLAYCDLVRRSTGERMTIAAAFTGGDADNLIVGRNGVFYDRKGQDWDATIVKIVDNPISIRQAFWAPYMRALRWIEDQVAKRAAADDVATTSQLTSALQTSGTGGAPGKAPEGKFKIDIGVVAALGVAVGGITAALGVLLQAFFGLGLWMPAGLVALILLISGPSMIIAALKLRQRNLGPILDANGWALNARARINIPFGMSLTGIARLPPGSKRDLADPYAESNAARNLLIAAPVLLVVVFGLWHFGAIERVIPGILPKSAWLKSYEETQEKEKTEKADKAAKQKAPKETPLPAALCPVPVRGPALPVGTAGPDVARRGLGRRPDASA
jgi:hypothetical protein